MRSAALEAPRSANHVPSSLIPQLSNVWLAPILSQRRSLNAVLDVLGGFDRDGISLSRYLELGVQWNKVGTKGLAGPMVLGDRVQRPGDGDDGLGTMMMVVCFGIAHTTRL